MRRPLLSFLLSSLCVAAFAQSQVWQSTPLPPGPPPGSETFRINRYASFKVELSALSSSLLFAPMEGPAVEGALVFMPSPDGTLKKFRLFESPMQTPAVQRQTGVKTYAGQGVDDPWATGRFDIGINGFHGMVYSPSGDYFIEPFGPGGTRDYLVYFQRDCDRLLCFKCNTTEGKSAKTPIGPPNITPKRPGPNRKEYRLAIKGTGEYTLFFGSVTSADANSVTVMNRVNGVYERDIAIRMVIVNLENFPNPATDPYQNIPDSPDLNNNQTTCDANPGNANYDIGHVFETGGGGIAGLGVVGSSGFKAWGVTGLPNPTGDPFAIDYVAHEMGHQYGASHSFNGTTNSCFNGRDGNHAYEPGSGSTIMAYAGICGSENIQFNSDDYFHIDSQVAIEGRRNNPASGGTVIPTGNNAPVVNAGSDFTIPQDTPFRLTATASDVDGDSLTYCWEQFNLGTASPTTNESTRPLFRSLKPAVSATRWFPKQSTVLANVFDQWENLPSVNRSMTFRCTVRDNRSGGGNYEFDSTVLTVSGAPFSVSAPNTNVVWAGGSNQTVTWNVGGGTSAANVRILLSLDGGNSYFSNSATTILASTPNDGSETIIVPNIATSQARIIVEAVGNIFYDVSNVNFTITPGSQFVGLSSYSVLTGDEPVHDVAALLQSDDVRLRVNSIMSAGATSHLEILATSPILTVSRLKFYLECQGAYPVRTRKISLFNFQSSSWEDVGTTSSTMADSFMVVDVTSNPSRFVNPATGEMRARVLKQSLTISRTTNRITDYFDQTVWEVFP